MKGTTNPGQSGSEGNGNEEVLHTPKLEPIDQRQFTVLTKKPFLREVLSFYQRYSQHILNSPNRVVVCRSGDKTLSKMTNLLVTKFFFSHSYYIFKFFG